VNVMTQEMIDEMDRGMIAAMDQLGVPQEKREEAAMCSMIQMAEAWWYMFHKVIRPLSPTAEYPIDENETGIEYAERLIRTWHASHEAMKGVSQ